MSEDNSLDFEQLQQSFHIAPLQQGANTKSNRHLFSSYNPNQIPTANKCLKVISNTKINDKWIVNQQFQNYLAEDDLNPDVVITSFLGPKKNGKSFLIDSLVTAESGNVCRLLTKSPPALVNCPAHNLKTRNNDKILYLDGDGQTSKQLFLWSYFISSIIVYNMSPNDRNEQDVLFEHLYYVQTHLETEADDLSQPQLIIVRRDVDNKSINDRDLLQRIQQYNLFQSEILCLHLPYPGTRGVKAKQLLDVPLKQLQPSYLNQTQRLLQIIKTGKPKIIKGNYLSSKIFSIALEPITRSMNKSHRINTNQVWNQIIETLSTGFYNFYLKTYSEELKKQFDDEKPCDRYTMYKKLSKLKRRVNKRVQGFNNIGDDPIFLKYKNRLDEAIHNKEQLMREVNSKKSRNANQKYCKKILSEINDSNYAQLIDEYCKSELDEQKTEVLLENFNEIMQLKSKQAKLSAGSNKKPTQEIDRLQREIQSLNRQISQELQVKPEEKVQAVDLSGIKNDIKLKQSKLQELQAEYDDLKNASKLMSKNQGEDERIVELEEECERLNDEIAQCNREIETIRKDRQLKMKETTIKMDKQLKAEEEKLQKLEQMLREAERLGQPKKGQAQGGAKNGCCNIM